MAKTSDSRRDLPGRQAFRVGQRARTDTPVKTSAEYVTKAQAQAQRRALLRGVRIAHPKVPSVELRPGLLMHSSSTQIRSIASSTPKVRNTESRDRKVAKGLCDELRPAELSQPLNCLRSRESSRPKHRQHQCVPGTAILTHPDLCALWARPERSRAAVYPTRDHRPVAPRPILPIGAYPPRRPIPSIA